jgi:dihydrofolate synthase/folylpolyglutamate synthase
VLERLALCPLPFVVVTVAGTNGKGSTVAMLDAILRAAGYRVGTYTSPHLVRYNERVRLHDRDASDAELCEAFARVEAVRGEVPLTYFEFGTLAALQLLARASLDVAVLEVGMGGRLDAVNAVDADCAVVTSVGIDHVQWLGSTREEIGREKAGVYRGGRPAICGDDDPPRSVLAQASAIGAELAVRGRDFWFERGATAEAGWVWRSRTQVRSGLPVPALRGDHQFANAATVLMALETLAHRLPVSQAQIRDGLAQARVAGRFQVIPGSPLQVLDVAHNAEAARALAQTLSQMPCGGRTIAVFGMLADKDIAAVTQAMRAVVDRWHVFTLAVPRGANAAALRAVLDVQGISDVHEFDTPIAAHAAALAVAQPVDRVVIFGSFYTVGDILARLT